MLSSTAGKPLGLSETQQITRTTGSVITTKIWLPRFLYNSLPYFYLIAGISAFFATLYISEWFWVLPHYLLFSAACIHLGISIFRRRRSSRPAAPTVEPS